MTTAIDIIDTAVKIGLGASISGVTTYFITKRSHRHELKKDMLSDKKELLKEIALKLEKCSSSFNHTVRFIYHLGKTTIDKSKEVLIDQQSEFTNAFNESKEARAIAYLISEPGLAELIDGYTNIVAEVAKHYDKKHLEYDLGLGDVLDYLN